MTGGGSGSSTPWLAPATRTREPTRCGRHSSLEAAWFGLGLDAERTNTNKYVNGASPQQARASHARTAVKNKSNVALAFNSVLCDRDALWASRCEWWASACPSSRKVVSSTFRVQGAANSVSYWRRNSTDSCSLMMALHDPARRTFGRRYRRVQSRPRERGRTCPPMQRHTHARPTPCPRPGNFCNGFYSSNCALTVPLLVALHGLVPSMFLCVGRKRCWNRKQNPLPQMKTIFRSVFLILLELGLCLVGLVFFAARPRKTVRTAGGFFLQELVRCFLRDAKTAPLSATSAGKLSEVASFHFLLTSSLE